MPDAGDIGEGDINPFHAFLLSFLSQYPQSGIQQYDPDNPDKSMGMSQDQSKGGMPIIPPTKSTIKTSSGQPPPQQLASITDYLLNQRNAPQGQGQG